MFRRLTSALGLLIALVFTAVAIASSPDPELRRLLSSAVKDEYGFSDRYEAEVWLLDMANRLEPFIPDPAQRLNLLQQVHYEARRVDIDPELVLAVIEVESHFDEFAISVAGARGLMQVMPFWRMEIGRPQDNLTHVETNIRYGTVILKHYFEVSKGDLVEALARYNGSYGRLKYPEKVIKAWRTRWRNKNRAELPELIASCNNYPLRACRHL